MATVQEVPRRLIAAAASVSTGAAKPAAYPGRRVGWSFSVKAGEVFHLCRALMACDDVDIQRCTAVQKRGDTRIRVDITLPATHIQAALNHVMRQVNDVEIGRTQWLGCACRA